MTTETITLSSFLLARIADDEEAAQAAIDPARPGAHWQWENPRESEDSFSPRWLRTVEEFPTTSGVGPLPAFPLGSEFMAEPARGMAHIARHDPARVLAECAAKRTIVKNCQKAVEVARHAPISERLAATDGPAAAYWRGQNWVLGQLAAVYSDHSDYSEDWRP